jgi:WD40 repeat protein
MNHRSDEISQSLGDPIQIPRETVQAQLDKILQSGRFVGSGQLKSLLNLIVAHRLHGNQSGLKETAIGTELFGRPTGYDSQSDSIVRTTAHRLRAELKRYYETDGANDPIIIVLPKGGYQPEFVRKIRGANESVEPLVETRFSSYPGLSRRKWLMASLAVAIVGFVVGVAVFSLRRRVVAGSPVTPNIGRLFAYSTSEGKNPIRLNLGYQSGPPIVTPDGSTLYAIELYGREVTVIGVDDLRVKRRFQLPHPARGAVISSNGRHLYIGSPDSVVMVLDTEHGNVERLIPTGRPVFDLSVTPDEKKVFLALGSAGLKRIAMPTGEIASLSEFACPLFLEMDREGKRLFVSYQCGGPGGRAGHDALEIYDTTSERTVRVIRDLPMVGGPPRVSPDGSLLLLDGLDACVTKTYDRVGCPVGGLGHVFHLVRISDGSVLKSFTRPTNTADAVFSPDGGRLVFGGDPLVVMDWARQMATEVAPVQGRTYNFLVFSPSGGRTFAASFAGGHEILVFDTEKRGCVVSPETLANQYSGDGTFDDTVGVSALTSVGAVEFAPGLIGQAFKFSGTGSILEGAGGAACWPCTENWTESFFARFNSINGEMTLLEREGGASSHWAHRIFKTRDNRIVLQVGNPSDRLSISTSTSVELNRWYHLALVSDSTRRDLYLDGVPQGHVDLVIPDAEPTNRGVVTIGASRGKRAALNGLVDEIAWYQRALAPNEVMGLSQIGRHIACRP